jgi:hypothetical protein
MESNPKYKIFSFAKGKSKKASQGFMTAFLGDISRLVYRIVGWTKR